MAGVEDAAVAVLGAARAEGGGGGEADCVAYVAYEAVVLDGNFPVVEEAEHGGRAVALA